MMLYSKSGSPDGAYVDAVGTRYDVSAARRVRSAEGVNVGYEAFPCLQDALEAWGLRAFPAEPLPTPAQGGS
ncbi:MAG: hypothetical protein IKY91_04610 [Akkermansia sp.]|nr:hypothetical protein [Akkermansia sp.]